MSTFTHSCGNADMCTDLSRDVIQSINHARGRKCLEAKLGTPTGQGLNEPGDVVADETKSRYVRILSWGVWVSGWVSE
jgi:hypothetical protein